MKPVLWRVYRLVDGLEPVDVEEQHGNYHILAYRSLSTQSFRASGQKGRPVCLCTGLSLSPFLPFISSSPSCQHVLPDTRARTRKPTEYSKKSCAFHGHGDILQTVDYHRGSVLKISVALGSHVPSAHKYWSCECHVSPSASGRGTSQLTNVSSCVGPQHIRPCRNSHNVTHTSPGRCFRGECVFIIQSCKLVTYNIGHGDDCTALRAPRFS